MSILSDTKWNEVIMEALNKGQKEATDIWQRSQNDRGQVEFENLVDSYLKMFMPEAQVCLSSRFGFTLSDYRKDCSRGPRLALFRYIFRHHGYQQNGDRSLVAEVIALLQTSWKVITLLISFTNFDERDNGKVNKPLEAAMVLWRHIRR